MTTGTTQTRSTLRALATASAFIMLALAGPAAGAIPEILPEDCADAAMPPNGVQEADLTLCVGPAGTCWELETNGINDGYNTGCDPVTGLVWVVFDRVVDLYESTLPADRPLVCSIRVDTPDNGVQDAQAIACLWRERGVCWELYNRGFSNGEQRGCVLRDVLP